MYFLPCVCWLVVLCASHTTCTLLLVILRLVLFFFLNVLLWLCSRCHLRGVTIKFTMLRAH